MENIRCKLLTVIAMLFIVTSGLEVSAVEIKKTQAIYDGGGRSTQHYIGAINIGGNRNKKLDTFPVVTEAMSVGRVGLSEGRGAKFVAASRPFFIVGYDAVSIDWLKANAALLIKRNAIGYVANVENKMQMDYLAQLLDNKLMLLPMNVSEISKELNIQHYPFYIDVNGVLR